MASLYLASAAGPGRFAGLEEAATISPLDWSYERGLGALAQASGRHRLAIEHFDAALRLYPACASCWIGLAESRLALGEDPTEALENARIFGRSDTEVRTRAAVVYARAGRKVDAAHEFAAAVAGRRDDKRDFFALLNRIYPPDFVLDQIVDDDELPAYFAYARHNLDPDTVAPIWQRYAAAGASPRVRREYAAYLLGAGRAREASRVAFGNDGPGTGTLLNGGFEDPLDRAGPFGWRLRGGAGVEVGVSPCPDCPSGGKAMRVAFDGEHNPDFFGVVQYVAVEPGQAYRLQARVRAQGITSASGPMLMVAGDPRSDSPCALRATSRQFRLTRPWKEVSLDFRTAPGCDLVRVMLVRRSSDAANKLIGGELWLDDLRLSALPG